MKLETLCIFLTSSPQCPAKLLKHGRYLNIHQIYTKQIQEGRKTLNRILGHLGWMDRMRQWKNCWGPDPCLFGSVAATVHRPQTPQRLPWPLPGSLTLKLPDTPQGAAHPTPIHHRSQRCFQTSCLFADIKQGPTTGGKGIPGSPAAMPPWPERACRTRNVNSSPSPSQK